MFGLGKKVKRMKSKRKKRNGMENERKKSYAYKIP